MASVLSENGLEILDHSLDNHPVEMEIKVIDNKDIEIKELMNRQSHEINLSWQNLSYSVKRKIKNQQIKIIENLTGDIKVNELMAVMGPSGAGKTTLLNILTGLIRKNVTGEIYVNGQICKSLRKFLCYVRHNDEMLPNLSLKETLMISANLKLGRTFSREEKWKIVKNAIDFWGLVECKDTLICHLSSGQKKRLSIAQEVINKPPLIFLDEPTSGLDSSSCFQCISLLKNLAEKGHTVICSIHQPSAKIFEQFDKLYILTDGQCLYSGLTKELVPFLSSHGAECPLYHNPADFVIEVAMGEHGSEVQKQLIAKNSEKYQNNDVDSFLNCNSNKSRVNWFKKKFSVIDSSHTRSIFLLNKEQTLIYNEIATYPTSSWDQFIILFGRTALCIFREPFLTRLSIISHVIIGIVMGLLYYGIGNDANKIQDNVACLFFSFLFLVFTSMIIMVLTFPLEMSVLKRENFNRWYDIKMYYLARTLADIPLQIFLPIIFESIVYWMTNQINDITRFIVFLLLTLMIPLISQSIGLCVGALVKVQIGVFLSPIMIVPLILFSGFFIRLNVIPSYMSWISYISYFRYGYEGLLLNIYGFNRTFLECSKNICLYQDPDLFLKDVGIEHSLLYVDFIALIGIFIFLRILAYIFLSWKIRNLTK